MNIFKTVALALLMTSIQQIEPCQAIRSLFPPKPVTCLLSAVTLYYGKLLLDYSNNYLHWENEAYGRATSKTYWEKFTRVAQHIYDKYDKRAQKVPENEHQQRAARADSVRIKTVIEQNKDRIFNDTIETARKDLLSLSSKLPIPIAPQFKLILAPCILPFIGKFVLAQAMESWKMLLIICGLCGIPVFKAVAVCYLDARDVAANSVGHHQAPTQDKRPRHEASAPSTPDDLD